MEKQLQRHQNCPVYYEEFGTLEQKGADCPVCLGHDPNWHCLGASHPRQLGKY